MDMFRIWYKYYEAEARAMNTTYEGGHVSNATDTSLYRFSETYASIHGYVSVCVCLFGVLTNVFNVTVLTRKNMRTPVNQILTWLAVSDMITMLSYIPFAIHFYCQFPNTHAGLENKNSLAWMSFLVFHINLTATTHTISIWMCVTLAIVRYLHITHPTRTNVFRMRRIHQTRIAIVMVYILSALVLIPNYLSNELHPNTKDNQTVYYLEDLKLGRPGTKTMVLVNVWIYAMIAKLIPCVLMIIFGSLLTYNIHVQLRHRRKVLQISGSNHVRLSEHSRTTKMLITVIILFIVTEFPQGILIVCSACVDNFFDEVYQPLGDLMDIMALVNNAINFVLYCSMSTKFRQTFVRLFCGAFQRRRRTTAEHDYQIALSEQNNGKIKIHHYDSNSNNNMLPVI